MGSYKNSTEESKICEAQEIGIALFTTSLFAIVCGKYGKINNKKDVKCLLSIFL
jgi:hypothetical protein